MQNHECETRLCLLAPWGHKTDVCDFECSACVQLCESSVYVYKDGGKGVADRLMAALCHCMA